MPVIPIVNKDVTEVIRLINERLEEPKLQRRVILVIVSIALLLDNMLYMVIVPIIPDYLRQIGAWHTHYEGGEPVAAPPPPPPAASIALNSPGGGGSGSGSGEPFNSSTNVTYTGPMAPFRVLGKLVYEGEDTAVGMLFASKAIVQLMINPFSGAIIDRIGYDIPMVIGLGVMFLSTAVFACGRSYSILFLARSMQGVGSAFADTAGLAMIADRFTEEAERTKALGIALAFISFGCLVAPPFGGFMYEVAGKEVPFIILSLVSFADGIMVLFVMKPIKTQMKQMGMDRLKGTPLWRLMVDPYIATCAAALTMANVSLAFLEPTISTWMMDNMNVTETQMGMIWLPAFFPHVFGVYLTVRLARDYPQYQWALACGGLALEGICCLFIPFAQNYWVLMLPICGICFGIALVDTALLPTLGFLVDVRYVSVYGSIYAIADISYSLAYAVGPIIAGGIVATIGFTALNVLIAVSNLAYCPMLWRLRNIYDYKQFESEANVLMSDPPAAQYQTYMMQESSNNQNDKTGGGGGGGQQGSPTGPVSTTDAFNHLELNSGYKETRFADPPSQQQNQQNQQQQNQQNASTNPFVSGGGGGQGGGGHGGGHQQQQQSTNPFVTAGGGGNVQHRQVSGRMRDSSEDEM